MKKIIFTFILMITSTFAFSQNALYYHIKATAFRGEIHKMLYGGSYTPKYQSLGKDIDNAIKDYENAVKKYEDASFDYENHLSKITNNKEELERYKTGKYTRMDNLYHHDDYEKLRKRIYMDRLEKTIKEQSNEKIIKKLEKKVEQRRKELDEATDKLEKLLTKYENELD